MQSIKIELPESFILHNRRFFKRSEIEHLKKCLFAKATGAKTAEYNPPETETFVNASQVARELGIARRTMARRIMESDMRFGRKHPAQTARVAGDDARALWPG